MAAGGHRRSFAFFITLGICVVVLLVTLGVAWVVLIGPRKTGILLILGVLFFCSSYCRRCPHNDLSAPRNPAERTT
jgi:hypothetical protein